MMVPRIDTHALKRTHPIAEVIAHYGIDLQPSGRGLIGRCPFHHDRGRPNLYVYPGTQTFYCYRCAASGDVVTFIERIERLDFRAAVARLAGTERPGERENEGARERGKARGVVASQSNALCPACSRSPALPLPRARPLGPDEQACLTAAVGLYHHRLLTDMSAMRYVAGRGIDVATVQRYRLGYAAGDELLDFLRWRRLPAGAAFRAGLLGPAGRETMTGRIVTPELRTARPVWLIGRRLGDGSREMGDGKWEMGDGESGSGLRTRRHPSPTPDSHLLIPSPHLPTPISHLPPPKYLGLPGRKPLLGWEGACGSRHVVVTEGVFDWLTLCQWGVPAVALAGTHARPDQMHALGKFARVYLALDCDDAGQRAADELQQALGPRAVTVRLPAGVHDVADLAVRAGGRDLFLRAIHEHVARSAA